jgi:hypothetical protein
VLNLFHIRPISAQAINSITNKMTFGIDTKPLEELLSRIEYQLQRHTELLEKINQSINQS